MGICWCNIGACGDGFIITLGGYFTTNSNIKTAEKQPRKAKRKKQPMRLAWRLVGSKKASESPSVMKQEAPKKNLGILNSGIKYAIASIIPPIIKRLIATGVFFSTCPFILVGL